jgi:hypothetical protein
MRLAHLVSATASSGTALVVGRGLVRKRDVKVAAVVVVGRAGELALDLLTGLDGEDVLEVEDGLLPVGVLGVRASGELDGLVAGGELDVEPRDHGVDVVGAAHGEGEGKLESEVVDGAGVKIEGKNARGVGDNGLELDDVDEGLGEGGVLERAVVEAPDVVPDCENSLACCQRLDEKWMEHTTNLVLLVVAVLDTSHEDGGLVREDKTLAVLAEVAITRPKDGVKHRLVEEEVAHPLRDDDINLGERKLDLLHLALEKGNLVREAVHLDDLPGLDNDGRHVNTDNVLCASLGGEHAENGGTAADIEDDLVLEEVGVVVDGIAVALGADLVLEHLLVDSMVVVGVEVVTVRIGVSDEISI